MSCNTSLSRTKTADTPINAVSAVIRVRMVRANPARITATIALSQSAAIAKRMPVRPLHNAAAVCSGGKVVDRRLKHLLPTYDVFDEHRYFEPGKAETFNTPSGRIELYSQHLAGAGHDPLPKYMPPERPPEGFFHLNYGRAAAHTFGRTINNPLLFELAPENPTVHYNLACSLALHGMICAKCAREFTAADRHLLTVHHKDGNHDNNPPDGSNWENLCVYCHEDEHSRRLLGRYYSEEK